MGATEKLRKEYLQQTFAVNVGGAFNLFQQTMNQFRRQRGGAIVTVASVAAHTPRIGMSAYGASKAALKSLALSVGLELAVSGVRCNVVSPGLAACAVMWFRLAPPTPICNARCG